MPKLPHREDYETCLPHHAANACTKLTHCGIPHLVNGEVGDFVIWHGLVYHPRHFVDMVDAMKLPKEWKDLP